MQSLEEMSINVHKIRQNQRIEYIEKNLIYQTQEEIAQELGVTKKTIYRDIAKWKAKGGLNQWLEKEFFELYGKEKLKDPSAALNRIMYLMGKQIQQAPTINININKQINELIQISREPTCNSSPDEQKPPS